MEIVDQFTSTERICGYLPDREARLEHQIVSRLSAQEYEERMDEGWRKFGPILFHPVCAACQACRPIRIPVADFTPGRSQKRALKRNADLTLKMGPPRVDFLRLDLYGRYHASQSLRKGWPDAEGGNPKEYALQFVRNPIQAVEISVWKGGTLLAVIINDITPNTVSAVYHFHDPEEASRGLGTFAILQTILLAEKLNKPYVYLGYFVAGSSSMAYKTHFKPYEILDTSGNWHKHIED